METVQVYREDAALAQQVAQAMLFGAGFSTFAFSTSFSLYFSRNGPALFRGQPLPSEVRLDLEGAWWFDDREEWAEKVARLAPKGAVEPEEPVQAYELAFLRWKTGSDIVSVIIVGSSISLQFRNGHLLTAAGGEDDEGPAWTLLEVVSPIEIVSPKSSPRWSVCSEGGELFVRSPLPKA